MDDQGKSFDMEKLREAFRSEAYELLGELEEALLALEHEPDNREQIGRVFRALHTIKGSGAACGFDSISQFTHTIENVYDLVRSGKLPVTRELIDLTLLCRDQISCLFDEYYGKKSVEPVRTDDLVARVGKLIPPELRPVKPVSAPAPEASGKQATYRIRFRPPRDIYLTGTNPLFLIDELRTLGTCRVVAQTTAIPLLEDLDPELCYVFWDVILTTDCGINAIRDVFIFVQDASELSVEIIDAGGLAEESEYKRLGDILVERGDLTPGDMKKAAASQKRFGEILVEKGMVQPDRVQAALTEQQHVRELRREHRHTEEMASVRVHSHKLDTLVNLVGELVTVQARLTQTAAVSGLSALISIAEEVERLTAELRDNTMSIRMLPIGTIFSKFKRQVRDLSQGLGKDVELVMDGAETELDKTVIERLSDPLMHLVRNCVDHGVEMPDAREAAGKPRQGTVKLSAVHSGAHVLISIQDDGGGLDTDAIRATAVERGLIAPDAERSEKELCSLIMAPGFSTAKAVTDVSGRGVGMDVVKRAVEALRGTIDIGSEKGRGTTITLLLPLTLAIIEGFLTRIGSDHFVFPLSQVEECVELTAARAAGTNGRDLLNVRGELVPYVRLRDRFGMYGNRPPVEQIVLTRTDGMKLGFVVDHVLGGHQTVIKNLGRMYRDVQGVSGATILGDGTVALILDIRKLARMADQGEAPTTAPLPRNTINPLSGGVVCG